MMFLIILSPDPTPTHFKKYLQKILKIICKLHEHILTGSYSYPVPIKYLLLLLLLLLLFSFNIYISEGTMFLIILSPDPTPTHFKKYLQKILKIICKVREHIY